MRSSPTSTKLIEHVTMLIHMAPDAEPLSRQADVMEDPIISIGPCSLANSRGMPVTTLGGLSPCRDQAISANPGGVLGIGCQTLPVMAQPPGLEWLVDFSSGWWLWFVALAIPCHRLLRRTLLHKLGRFYCSSILSEWVLPICTA